MTFWRRYDKRNGRQVFESVPKGACYGPQPRTFEYTDKIVKAIADNLVEAGQHYADETVCCCLCGRTLDVYRVLAVGIIGAIIVRFRPHGMARALFATAFAQALVAVIVLIIGLGLPWSPPVEILALNRFFVSLFVGSAMLFRYAARELAPAGAGPEG